MHNIEPLISDLKDILVKVDSLLAKFAELCQSEKSVKKTLFYRTRHAMTHVEKMKVNIQQLLRRLDFRFTKPIRKCVTLFTFYS